MENDKVTTTANVRAEALKPPVATTSRVLTSKAIGNAMDKKLGGDVKTSERSLTLVMKPGEKPKITFVGYWDGKFVQAAINSISKAYRLRRYEIVKTKGDGDGSR